MQEFIQTYISELIAILAVVCTVVASSRACSETKRANRLQEKLDRENHLEKRTNLILEVEKQNALIGKLLLIIAKKLILLSEAPHIIKNSENEVGRLRGNIIGLESLRYSAEDKLIFERPSSSHNPEIYNKAFTKIRQLTVNLEADYEKEKYEYEELFSKSQSSIA